MAKPCPFCGATKIHFEEGNTYRWGYMVCSECEAHGPVIRRSGLALEEGTRIRLDTENATAEWEKRS